jgi:hypothetical protein
MEVSLLNIPLFSCFSECHYKTQRRNDHHYTYCLLLLVYAFILVHLKTKVLYLYKYHHFVSIHYCLSRSILETIISSLVNLLCHYTHTVHIKSLHVFTHTNIHNVQSICFYLCSVVSICICLFLFYNF